MVPCAQHDAWHIHCCLVARLCLTLFVHQTLKGAPWVVSCSVFQCVLHLMAEKSEPRLCRPRCVARASSWSSLGGLYYRVAPSLGFYCPCASPCCPPVPHSSPRRAQGRPVPSLTYLLIIPRAWGDWVTGRPPTGRRLSAMARNKGREGTRKCLQPPPGPLPYNAPTGPSLPTAKG